MRLQSLWNARVLLFAGLALRVLVFAFLSPSNNDTGHLDNLQFMAAHGRLPLTGETSQSYHPPLAYLLAIGPFLLAGAKAAQAVSLLISCATLWVIYRALHDSDLISDERVRTHGMALAAFVPEWVFYGLFISNDSLSYLLGAVIFYCACVSNVRRRPGALVLLAVLCGLGLLTKYTFLATAGVLGAVLVMMAWQRGASAARALGAGVLFAALAFGIGGYKLIENERHLGKVLVTNLDYDYSWVIEQRASHRGAASYLGLDVIELLRHPVGSIDKSSYPLMLYSTLWYPRISNANIGTTRLPPFCFIGSLAYVAGSVPTLIGLLGLALGLARGRRALVAATRRETLVPRDVVLGTAALLVLANLALLVSALVRYHVWSIMQARLLLPSALPLLVAYDAGLRSLSPGALRDRLVGAAIVALVGLYLLLYGIEGGYHVVKAADPSTVQAVKHLFGAP
jgi:predicted metal-binding membrane protein